MFALLFFIKTGKTIKICTVFVAKDAFSPFFRYKLLLKIEKGGAAPLSAQRKVTFRRCRLK